MTKRKPGRPHGSAVTKAIIHVEVPVPLRERIVALAEKNNRKITGEIIVALERHLAAEERPSGGR